jgi:hypothetical protein
MPIEVFCDDSFKRKLVADGDSVYIEDSGVGVVWSGDTEGKALVEIPSLPLTFYPLSRKGCDTTINIHIEDATPSVFGKPATVVYRLRLLRTG